MLALAKLHKNINFACLTSNRMYPSLEKEMIRTNRKQQEMQCIGLNLHISAAGSKKSQDQIHQMAWLGCPVCVCFSVCVCRSAASGVDPGWSRGMQSIKASGCWGRGVVLPWRDWKRRPAIICFPGSSWKRAEDTHTRDWPPPPAPASLICYHHIPLPFCSFPPFFLNPHLSSLPGLVLQC